MSSKPRTNGANLKLAGALFAINGGVVVWVGVQLQRLNGDYSTSIVGGAMVLLACALVCAGIVAGNRDR
jgi:hypothetical protein